MGPNLWRIPLILACTAAVLPFLPRRFDSAGHQAELLFGFVPLLILGFMTVALPRWLGRAMTPEWLPSLLTAVHAPALATRFLDLPAGLAAQSLAAAVFSIALLANVAYAKAWRSLYPAALAALLSGAAVAESFTAASGLLVGVAAVVLLCIEIGNRIAVALAAAALELRGVPTLPAVPAALVWTERIASAAALGAWAVGIPSIPMILLATGAGLRRLQLLRPMSSHTTPGVLGILTGLGWCHIGTGLLALYVAEWVPAAAPLHAWAIGGVGMLGIGIVTSIVRKKERTPFGRSRVAEFALVACGAAAFVRIAAAGLEEPPALLFAGARFLWVAAFCLCIGILLRQPVWSRSCPPPSASPS